MDSEVLLPPQDGAAEPLSVPRRQHRWITIEPVQFLYWVYMSGSMPLVSQFIHSKIELAHNTTHVALPCTAAHNNSSDYALATLIQSEASTWLLYLDIAAMIPGLFSTVIISQLSEQWGRKATLTLPLIGAVLRMVIFIVVFALNLPIAVLILSSMLDGVCGMSCTMLMLCYTYLTDITDSRQRSFRIGLLECFAGFAYVVASIGTGYSIKYLGYKWTFAILLALVVINFLYVVLILEESLVRPPSQQIPAVEEEGDTSKCSASWCRSCWEPFSRMFCLYVKDLDRGSRRWQLQLTLALMFIITVVQFGRQQIWTLFMLAYPLCFSSVLIGYYYACEHIVTNVSSVAAIKLLVARLGDIGLLLVGCVSGVAFQLVFGFSVSLLMTFLGTLAGFGSKLPITLLRAHNSKIVEPNEIDLLCGEDSMFGTFKGVMFASMAWMQTFGVLIGSVVNNSIYSASVGSAPYAAFVFGAGVYVVAALGALYFLLARSLRWGEVVNECREDLIREEGNE